VRMAPAKLRLWALYPGHYRRLVAFSDWPNCTRPFRDKIATLNTNRAVSSRMLCPATLQPRLASRISLVVGGINMRSLSCDACVHGAPSASHFSVGLRSGVRSLAAVMLVAGLTGCAQSSLVTNQTALQGTNRQKSVVFAHAHTHFTTHTRIAEKKGASYALASFYGEDTNTASGEKFNPNELTAAHPTLPFGTRLRVTNVANGRSVIVRVNDRGPFVRGRTVDVSSSAAERIGMIDQGVAKVKLDVIH